ncbi:unnamed protein product [Nippostrongylus brasiliensis]|uniref:DUF16 domain-containing protein n=1 Tax=Nippostrongylus brasiliensis TaxID=27835 RepID=A0A0N4Y125_NIPBR|nr:unnamed protein product [Nippostrongylus brasiliensis]
MSLYALVFFLKTSKFDVVPLSAIRSEPKLSKLELTKVRKGSRFYSAKLLFFGSKDLCEERLDLAEEVSAVLSDSYFARKNKLSHEKALIPSPPQREIMKKIDETKDDLVFETYVLRTQLQKMSSGERRFNLLEDKLEEILRRLAPVKEKTA